MQLHQLKPIHKPKKPKRIGLGGAHGSHSGRGVKGQRVRAGKRLKPIIREWIKRYPKLRGYKFKKVKLKPAILNVGILGRKFEADEIVSPKILIEKKLIRKIEGRIPKVKILGEGEMKKALVIENCIVSKQAKEKIEKVGGKIQ